MAAAELTRINIALVGKTNLCQQNLCFLDYFGFIALLYVDGCFNQVFQNSHVRKKVELLEYHAHFAGNAADIIVLDVFRATGGFTAQLFTVDGDAAFIDCFQLVEAAQQGAFAAAGRTDYGNNFAFVYFQVDAFEYFQIVEFFQILVALILLS